MKENEGYVENSAAKLAGIIADHFPDDSGMDVRTIDLGSQFVWCGGRLPGFLVKIDRHGQSAVLPVYGYQPLIGSITVGPDYQSQKLTTLPPETLVRWKMIRSNRARFSR